MWKLRKWSKGKGYSTVLVGGGQEGCQRSLGVDDGEVKGQGGSDRCELKEWSPSAGEEVRVLFM